MSPKLHCILGYLLLNSVLQFNKLIFLYCSSIVSAFFSLKWAMGSVVKFWAHVYTHKTSSGNAPFQELALHALACLTTPVSNTSVEKVFSNIAYFKTNLRKRMQISILESLLRIKTHLISRDICCTKFKVTSEMMQLFNAKKNLFQTKLSKAKCDIDDCDASLLLENT